MPQLPRTLYHDARRRYGNRRVYSRAGLASKRARLIIRLVALEEVCSDWGMGVLPQRTMATLRLLADYKDLHRKSIWNIRGIARRVGIDIPLHELVMACGHPRPTAPVVAVLREGDPDFDSGSSLRGFFCSEWCAKQGNRRVVALLHYDPSPIKVNDRQELH